MRGQLLSYDAKTASGIISGDDGNRYNFQGKDVGGDIGQMNPGAKLDFDIKDGAAVDIFVVEAGRPAPGSGTVGKKSKVAAGLLAIFLGGLGIHKFYIGASTAGVIMLLVSVLGVIALAIPTLIIGIIALIEGIIYLTKTDEDFYQTYEVNKKAWF
ncbi:MAG: TM2 domain-containing protein [Pseudomonadota bacterium]